MPSDTFAGQTHLLQQFQAIRENDEKALQDLYQKNFYKTERYVLDNSGTTDEAKDIYQEAFIAVWRNVQLGRFQPQHNGSLEGYLFQLAKNKWLDHLRTARRKPVVPLTESINSLEAIQHVSEEEQALLNLVKKNMQQLGPQCRDVLERFYYRRQSLRTISEAFGWTEATAKNNKYRCLQRLKDALKNNKPLG